MSPTLQSGKVILLLQAGVLLEPVAGGGRVYDLDRLLERLVAQGMAGFTAVADALRSMLARAPVPELLVHNVGATVITPYRRR